MLCVSSDVEWNVGKGQHNGRLLTVRVLAAVMGTYLNVRTLCVLQDHCGDTLSGCTRRTVPFEGTGYVAVAELISRT